MKVLVAFPKDGQTGLFIAKGFQACSCDVEYLCANTEVYEIARFLEVNPGCLVVCSRTAGLAKVMGLRYHRKLVCWNTDVRRRLDDFQKELGDDIFGLWRKCNAIYTMAKGQVHEYRDFLGKHIRWLSQGIDPETHHVPVATPEDEKKYGCEVMFAGSYKSKLHKDRIRLIEEVGKRFDLKLYGYGTKVVDEEHNKACWYAGVCLGNSAFPHIELSMSVRDYKVMGAGGLLLTNHVVGIEKWFGDAALYYDSVSDCLAKIERILKADERWRMLIKRSVAGTMHAKHTYADRCRVILEDLEKGLF